MKFLIEANIFPEDDAKLIAALKELRVEYALWNKDGRPPYKSAENDVFFYGSIHSALALRRLSRFQIWLGPEFDYTYFTAHLEDCLNQDIVTMPYGSMIREWNALLEHNKEDKLFFRSNSGYKNFQGGLYTADEFVGEAKRVNLFKEDLIIAADPKEIHSEHRLVIRSQYDDVSGLWKHKVITDSCYIGSDKLTKNDWRAIENDLDTSSYHPYPLWILDIAVCGVDLKQIEANSINSSGLYNCDYKAIVNEILDIEKKEIVK